MKLLTVVGARPQFVKAAVVSRAVRSRHEEVLVHTGQHYDDALSGSFFRDLGVPAPDVNLGAGSRTAGPRMAAMIRGIAAEIRGRRPDVVIVYGDTDSTQAGALAARECGVRLAHVETGARSFDLRMPEEINRIVADHLSALALCATATAAVQLRFERACARIEVVGDVMLDACLAFAPAARKLGVPARHSVAPGAYYAATLHRAGNTDDPARLTAILWALATLDLPVLLACHPRTRAAIEAAALKARLADVRLLPPLPYPEMLGLVADAKAVLTDSGGLQREAYYLGVPCVTLREETEWVETIASGWNRLADADPARIRAAVLAAVPQGRAPDVAAFGGGRAGERVLAALEGLGP